jgi:hypothetical protein
VFWHLLLIPRIVAEKYSSDWIWDFWIHLEVMIWDVKVFIHYFSVAGLETSSDSSFTRGFNREVLTIWHWSTKYVLCNAGLHQPSVIIIPLWCIAGVKIKFQFISRYTNTLTGSRYMDIWQWTAVINSLQIGIKSSKIIIFKLELIPGSKPYERLFLLSKGRFFKWQETWGTVEKQCDFLKLWNNH